MTFQDLKNFPVFIKQVGNDGHIPSDGHSTMIPVNTVDTDFIKIHANGTYEIINTYQDGPYRLMSYGIDSSGDSSLLNFALADCIVIDAEQWANALNQLKKFLPED